jgi:excisionase family DNA binding protein
MKSETESTDHKPIDKKALAEYLGVTTRTIENWTLGKGNGKGIIPYWKIGRSVRFDLKAVRAALDARCGRNIEDTNGH